MEARIRAWIQGFWLPERRILNLRPIATLAVAENSIFLGLTRIKSISGDFQEWRKVGRQWYTTKTPGYAQNSLKTENTGGGPTPWIRFCFLLTLHRLHLGIFSTCRCTEDCQCTRRKIPSCSLIFWRNRRGNRVSLAAGKTAKDSFVLVLSLIARRACWSWEFAECIIFLHYLFCSWVFSWFIPLIATLWWPRVQV